jgi:hypothetical protein
MPPRFRIERGSRSQPSGVCPGKDVDANGSFATTRTVPALTYGLHTLIAQGGTSRWIAIASFTMKPLLVLIPNSGTAGSSSAARAFGVGPLETVLLYWDTPTGPAIKSTVSSTHGAAATTFTVPAEAPPGQHLVFAVGQLSHAEGVALFIVRVPPPPPTASSRATRVAISTAMLTATSTARPPVTLGSPT